MITVYLAGAMSGFHESGEYHKATEWRDYTRDCFAESNIRVFDPTHNSLRHFTYSTDLNRGVIHQNHAYLKKCDIVLVNLERLDDSVGSVWEISMAWADHKPVIGFGSCEKWESRPHFQSLITASFGSVGDACDYIISMYNQKI